MRLFFASLLAAFGLSAAALAAPVDLPPAAQVHLDQGGQVRVIVWFDIPTPDFSTLEESEHAAASAAMHEARTRVIEDALDVRATDLAGASSEGDTTRIIHQFRYAPMAAMLLSQADIDRLSARADVLRIEYDELAAPTTDVSVPLIGANVMHGNGQTGVGRSVAILDTGVDIQHPTFAGRITGSACFSSTVGGLTPSTSFCPGGVQVDTTSPDAGDNCEFEADAPGAGGAGCDHGTHVASIAASASFTHLASSRTVRGVAPGAGIVAVQVFSRFTSTDSCGSTTPPCVLSYSSDQRAALEWLFANRVALNLSAINMSLGGGRHFTHCAGDSRRTVVQQLRAAGIATVISSGNNGYPDSVGAPGCIEEAITVGSTTKMDALSGFSNSATMVDMLAPGSSIFAAVIGANDSGALNAGTKSGTSMAAPHVAGAFTLLQAANPGASVDLIEAALEATGVPVFNPSNNITQPRIQVDAANAMIAGGGNAGALQVTPLDSFVTAGVQGNQGSFGTTTYTLTNTGGSTLNWEAFSTSSILTFNTAGADPDIDSPDAQDPLNAQGSLGAGASVEVIVGVNAAALPGGGVHYASAQFETGANSTSRAAYISVEAPGPLNDDFENAFPLSALEGVYPFTNVGASKQTGEPNHAGTGGASVWWSWTPATNVQARIQTQNHSFDTMLAVYTGNAVNALTQIAQNDDCSGCSLASRVEFAATAGTTYHIAVDGFGAAQGTADLAFSVLGAPANDAIASAIALPAGGGSRAGQNINATKVGGEPNHGGNAGGASVWYTWTPGASGPAHFDTHGSNFDTLLAVYTSPDGGTTLNLVGQSDDASGASDASAPESAGYSAVDFAATSGTTYYVAVDGKNGATGAFRLTHRINGPADDRRLRAAVLPNARAVVLGDAASAFATVINPPAAATNATNCRIEAPLGFNGPLVFNTTNPNTNEANGVQNQPVAIAAGASQTFVFALFPGVAMNGVEVEPVFICDQIGQPLTVSGVTTINVTATEAGTADVIAISATIDQQGAVVPINGATAFSVAGVNIGEAASITVTPAPPAGVTLPLTLTICESDPNTGICLAPRTASVTVAFANGQTRTFSVRVGGQGEAVAFTPATNRVVVTFEDNDASVIAGSTSVAVQTNP